MRRLLWRGFLVGALVACSGAGEDGPRATSSGGTAGASGSSSGAGGSAGVGGGAGTNGNGGTQGDSDASGAGGSAGVGIDAAIGDANDANPASGQVRCERLSISGNPEAPQGATWTYDSVDDQVEYRLTGILRRPAGSARVPAVVISHGKGGMPGGYSRNIAVQMVPWGLLAIGVAYTHAATDTGLPAGGDGASPANIQRAKKTRELLSCLPNVDTSQVAAHGHSMGAFLTAALVGSFPDLFQAASHTAGGTSQGPNATPPSLAMQIRTPYQIHHGDADMVVALAQDQALDQILTTSGTEHEFYVYPGVDHAEMSQHATMLSRVHDWYVAQGVLPP